MGVYGMGINGKLRRITSVAISLALCGLGVVTSTSASATTAAGTAPCNSCGGGPANIEFTGAGQSFPSVGISGDIDIVASCEGVATNNVVITDFGMHCWVRNTDTQVNSDGTGVNRKHYAGNAASETIVVTDLPPGNYELCMDGNYNIGTETWYVTYANAICLQKVLV